MNYSKQPKTKMIKVIVGDGTEMEISVIEGVLNTETVFCTESEKTHPAYSGTFGGAVVDKKAKRIRDLLEGINI